MESFRMEMILKILSSSCYLTTAKATTKPCSQVAYLLNPFGAGDHAGLERDKSFGCQSRRSDVRCDLCCSQGDGG